MRATHLTVAAVIERDGRFLLVEEEAGGRTVLNQPAGHWEDGETALEAVVRETLEETGWHVRPTHLLGLYDHKPADLDHGFLRLAYVAVPLRHDAARPLDPAILRTHWLTDQELASCADRHRSPMVRRCVDDYRAGRRFPLDVLAALADAP